MQNYDPNYKMKFDISFENIISIKCYKLNQINKCLHVCLLNINTLQNTLYIFCMLVFSIYKVGEDLFMDIYILYW